MAPSSNSHTERFARLRKTLDSPLSITKRRNANELVGRIFYAFNNKRYGYNESWDNILDCFERNALGPQQNLFHEVIYDNTKVKPYLDVEWYECDYPNYDPRDVETEICDHVKTVFQEQWDLDINKRQVLVATCHRNSTCAGVATFKYSFRFVVKTEPCCFVFESTTYAKFLARQIREKMFDRGTHSMDIVDLHPYKKLQMIRLPNQCKEGDNTIFEIVSPRARVGDFVLTNIPKLYQVLPVNEQPSAPVINSNTVIDTDQETFDFIMQKVLELHPSASFIQADANGFYKFNYTDRTERCFIDNRLHDQIGFYVFVDQNNDINAGCFSSNCCYDDGKHKKIRIGNVSPTQMVPIENRACSFDEEFVFSTQEMQQFTNRECLSLINMFEAMYLKPVPRIKYTTLDGPSFYYWDGKLWRKDEQGFIERLVAETTERALANFKITLEDADQRKFISRIIVSIQTLKYVRHIMNLMKPTFHDAEFPKICDMHKNMLSCNNGMVDLYTGEIRPSAPSDNITKSIPIDYDPNVISHDFDNFVREITADPVFGFDEEKYNYLRWAIGYAMQGNANKKYLFVLYGARGYEGKSLLMNTINEVLTDYYSVNVDQSVAMTTSKKTAGAASPELMQIDRKRFGIQSDTADNASFHSGQVKPLTSAGDRLSVRQLYGQQREICPNIVLFILTNHLIRFRADDDAMFERIMPFQLKMRFVSNPDPNCPEERKSNPQLAEIFKNSKQGILGWLVECAKYFLANFDKKPPKFMTDFKDHYRREVNPFIKFIDAHLDARPNAIPIPFNEVNEKLRQYLVQNGVQISDNRRREMLTKLLNPVDDLVKGYRMK